MRILIWSLCEGRQGAFSVYCQNGIARQLQAQGHQVTRSGIDCPFNEDWAKYDFTLAYPPAANMLQRRFEDHFVEMATAHKKPYGVVIDDVELGTNPRLHGLCHRADLVAVDHYDFERMFKHSPFLKGPTEIPWLWLTYNVDYEIEGVLPYVPNPKWDTVYCGFSKPQRAERLAELFALLDPDRILIAGSICNEYMAPAVKRPEKVTVEQVRELNSLALFNLYTCSTDVRGKLNLRLKENALSGRPLIIDKQAGVLLDVPGIVQCDYPEEVLGYVELWRSFPEIQEHTYNTQVKALTEAYDALRATYKDRLTLAHSVF